MEKIDYEAIVESLWNTEEVMKDIMIKCCKEAAKQAIEITLQTVANEAVVDYNIISLEKGGEIETYIIQGSLDSIKEKLLKELL